MTAPAPPHWMLSVSIGPVSDFIATARRMADLWAGSQLLSHLCQFSLAWLGDAHRNLNCQCIFPSGQQTHALSTPNRFVVVIQCQDPKPVASALEDAVRKELRTIAEATLLTFDPDASRADHQRLLAQCDDLLEFYAAWRCCPVDALASQDETAQQAYRDTYQRVQAMLVARKRSRNFLQAAAVQVGIAKTALGAARETVLRDAYLASPQAADRRHRLRFGIADEHLDAAGLIKRVRGRSAPFAALTRVALEPWLRELKNRNAQAFSDLDRAYGQVCKRELGSRSKGSPLGFCWEGQLLLPGRLHLERQQWSSVDFPEEHQALGALGAAQQAALQALRGREPLPYVALVALDIDEFGKALWQADRPAQQQLASLAEQFAQQVVGRVEDEGGAVFYAAGDEALLALPVASALACMTVLHSDFQQRARDAGLPKLTLSAGVAVAHVMTPLGRLRDMALRALEMAKNPPDRSDQPRNALALLAKPRAGELVVVRSPWHEAGVGRLVDRLALWTRAMGTGSLPRSAPHLLEQAWALSGGHPSLLLSELRRFAQRRSEGAAAQDWLAPARALLTLKPQLVSWGAARLRSEWLLARWWREHRLPAPEAVASACAAAAQAAAAGTAAAPPTAESEPQGEPTGAGA